MSISIWQGYVSCSPEIRPHRIKAPKHGFVFPYRSSFQSILSCLSVNINENATKCQVRSGFEHLELEIRILIKFQLTRSAEEALKKEKFQDNLRAAEQNHLYNGVMYSICTIHIYIYIYALYHLGYKTKSWNLKMVWCLLLLPCEG